MLLISHHPVVSVSVHMFKKMILNYMKLMTWYAAFILAFAVSFYILFTEKNPVMYDKYTVEYLMLNITKVAFTPPNPLVGEFGVNHLAFAFYYFFVTIMLFTLLNVASMTKALSTNAQLVKFVSQAKFIIDLEKSAPDLISLLGALSSCYQSLIERRLKRRKKQRDNSRLYHSALVPPSSVDRKVYVLVNQKNRIAAKNMKFKAKEADGSSCIFCAKNWSFLKSSIEDAKKILSKRASEEMWSSSGDKGTEYATDVVAELQNRLLAVEKALKTAEEKLQNFVEEAIKRTSLQDQLKFASTMKTTEDRLQNVVEDASKRAVAEIRRFLGEILPHARTDADCFYST